jgi:hypothetical protein
MHGLNFVIFLGYYAAMHYFDRGVFGYGVVLTYRHI